MRSQPLAAAAAFATLLGLASAPALAAPCAGFTDVQDTDLFCADVAWIRNAGITTGCGGTLYCPLSNVPRWQMASFLRRLANAMRTDVNFTESSTPPTGDLDVAGNGPVACTTVPITVPANGDQRITHVSATVSLRANGPADVQMWLARSNNGGTLYNAMDHAEIPLVTVPAAGQWVSAAVMGGRGDPIDPGMSTRYRLEFYRAPGSLTTGELTGVICQVKVWNEVL